MDEGELLALLTGVRQTPIRVCRINPYYANMIGAHSDLVFLSRPTIEKQETKHHDRNLTLYLLAETILTSWNARIYIADNKRSLIYVWRSAKDEAGRSQLYKATVKATRVGHELYLVSVHRTDETGARSTAKRNRKVRG